MVEGAALEMLFRGNFNEGSNPSLSVPCNAPNKKLLTICLYSLMTQHFIVKIRAMKTQHKAARSSVGIESLQRGLHLRLPRKVNGRKLCLN